LPCIAHDKQRVGQTTLVRRSRGTARGLDEAGGTRIDPDRQNIRARASEIRHRGAVSGAQVEDRPRVAANELVELPDVELGQVMANDQAHGSRIIAHWR